MMITACIKIFISITSTKITLLMDTNNVHIIIKQNKIKRGYEEGMEMQWSEEEACPLQCLDVVRIHEGARCKEGR